MVRRDPRPPRDTIFDILLKTNYNLAADRSSLRVACGWSLLRAGQAAALWQFGGERVVRGVVALHQHPH